MVCPVLLVFTTCFTLSTAAVSPDGRAAIWLGLVICLLISVTSRSGRTGSLAPAVLGTGVSLLVPVIPATQY